MTLVVKNLYVLSTSLDDVPGMDDLWFVGDNFLAETFRKYFKKRDREWFTKENFEISVFCSSKHSDSNSNMISRLINSFAYGLNNNFKVPKYIVLLMDDDLIQYLGFIGKGTTRCYGEWLEYIVKTMLEMIKIRLASLPKKALKFGYPQIYLVSPPKYILFEDNKACTRLINAMEAMCRVFSS